MDSPGSQEPESPREPMDDRRFRASSSSNDSSEPDADERELMPTLPPGESAAESHETLIDSSGSETAVPETEKSDPHDTGVDDMPDTLFVPSPPESDSSDAKDGAGDDGTVIYDFSVDDVSAGVEEAVRAGQFPEISGYTILGELGRGGMGVVYRARQAGLNRIVALKMILAGGHAGAEQLARFRAEAEAGGQLQHPNIVQVYDVGEIDGMPFFSLEFVDGQSLRDAADDRPQPPEQAAKMLETLACAMQYAHEHGIIHRDLKPENVLLTETGTPKVADFGLAKQFEGDSSQTRTGTIMGTPSYMAPEQGRGEKEIGPPADIYALGSLLYYLLTGRPPFLSPKPVETLMQLLNNEPVPPSQLQPHLSRDLETICMKCLQKDAKKRYASAQELADDLRRFLNNEPIQARPVSQFERFGRWCRRNRALAASLATVSVVTIGAAIGGVSAAIVINQERNIAVQAREDEAAAREEAEEKERIATTARAEEAAAKREAEENLEIAHEQALLAVNTMNDVVTNVEEKLRDRAELSDLRQNVLKLATEGLNAVARTDDNAALADRTMGAAYHRMAEVVFKAGRSADARRNYQAALTIFEKLLQRSEAEDADLVMYNAALTYDGLGDLASQIDQDAAKAHGYFTKALELRKRLLTEAKDPRLTPVQLQAVLINSYNRLTNVAMEMQGDPHAAREYCDRLVEHSEALSEALPENHPLARQAVSGAHFRLAQVHFHLGDFDAARPELESALAVRRELLADQPDSIKAKQDVAVALWELAELERLTERSGQMMEHVQEAHGLRESLYNADPDNTEMRWDLSRSFYRLGIAHRMLRDPGEASDAFRESLKLREAVVAEDPENTEYRIKLMLTQAHCGKHVEASQAAEELRIQVENNPGALVDVAGGYALCISAVAEQTSADSLTDEERVVQETYARQALETLAQALDSGYANAVTLETSPELEAIRSRPQYEQLVASLR